MRSSPRHRTVLAPRTQRILLGILLVGLCLIQAGCVAPIGAERVISARAYQQGRVDPVSHGQMSQETRYLLRLIEQEEEFTRFPDVALQLIHERALKSGARDCLFALAELSYHAGEHLRRSVKPWEPRDARDYYLASAVYAWLFLFGDAADPPPGEFDQRFRTACDLYNFGLGWALTERRSTNALAVLEGGVRRLPVGRIELEFSQPSFPWPLSDFDHFSIANQYLVRGLSMRNRQPGLGTALVAMARPTGRTEFARAVPATVVLRLNGGLSDLAHGRARGSLELYSPFETSSFLVGSHTVPLETDITLPAAYTLNQSFVWRLGRRQFLSAVEQIPTDVYLTQPYREGRVPVVFVHGTFSSPAWWAEMINTLSADPVLRQRYQFWYFIYNSGNPTVYSSGRLRESLKAKIKELDPGGKDAALQQMVVVGHSQGGLLTKLTATDTGDTLLQVILKTNRLEDLNIPLSRKESIRNLAVYEALPFVKRVVFVSTPHRGSYLAGGFVRRLARRLVSLPSALVDLAGELGGLQEKFDLPKELKDTPTSLDSMSPRNPFLLALADIPLAPGIKGHSIIAVEGTGDYHEGKDGLVSYRSAHVDYVESEFIVRSFHSCQGQPPTIEEVRRILHEHLRTLTANVSSPAGGSVTPVPP